MFEGVNARGAVLPSGILKGNIKKIHDNISDMYNEICFEKKKYLILNMKKTSK